MTPQVLVLGDAGSREMLPVLAAVRRQVPADRLRSAADLPAVRRLLDHAAWFPDLVVVCQNWPDEFSALDVQHLMALLPLARIVCCCGDWCDSDGRTRSIWPPAVRIPATVAAMRLGRELAWFSSPGTASGPHPYLPLTASRREIFEVDYEWNLRPAGSSVPAGRVPADATSVAVISPDVAWRSMIESVLKGQGYRCLATPSLQLPARFESRLSGSAAPNNRTAVEAEVPGRVMWDADPWSREQADRLRTFRRQHPSTECVVFLGFPRADTVDEILAAGADRVCWKLAPLGNAMTECCR